MVLLLNVSPHAFDFFPALTLAKFDLMQKREKEGEEKVEEKEGRRQTTSSSPIDCAILFAAK